MTTKPQRIINGIMILAFVPLALSLGVLISALAGYKMFPDAAFIIPLFLGTAIFFVGSYLEAKHENTFGIDLYISNRKTKMRSAVLGCALSVIMSILSLFVV